MKRITVLAIACVVQLIVSWSALAKEQPNVVLILTDHYGWGEPGVHGGGFLRGAPTPHILPTPDYSGAVGSRSTLTGDWGGTRGEWASKGFHVDLDTGATDQKLVDGFLFRLLDIKDETAWIFGMCAQIES